MTGDELVRLDVTAGGTVAYAEALLRCGMTGSPPSRTSGCG